MGPTGKGWKGLFSCNWTRVSVFEVARAWWRSTLRMSELVKNSQCHFFQVLFHLCKNWTSNKLRVYIRSHTSIISQIYTHMNAWQKDIFWNSRETLSIMNSVSAPTHFNEFLQGIWAKESHSIAFPWPTGHAMKWQCSSPRDVCRSLIFAWTLQHVYRLLCGCLANMCKRKKIHQSFMQTRLSSSHSLCRANIENSGVTSSTIISPVSGILALCSESWKSLEYSSCLVSINVHPAP